MTLDDAIGYISDHVLARTFGVDRKEITAKRLAMGKPGVRSDHWRLAIDTFGFDRTLNFLVENGASEATIQSLKLFFERRAAPTLDVKREKPLGRVRKRISGGLTASEKKFGEEISGWSSPPFPATRGDCEGGPRPCPLVRCKYHLALDYYATTLWTTKRSGEKVQEARVGLVLMPELLRNPVEVLQSMRWTCLLDAIDANDGAGYPLEDVGFAFDLTRERVRQIEEEALGKISNLRETNDMANGFDIRVLARKP